MGGIRYILGGANSAFAIKACDCVVHSFKPHFHVEVSLALVEAGSSTVMAGGHFFELTGPLLVLIPAGMAHQCSPQDPDLWRFKMLYITADCFDTVLGLAHKSAPFAFLPLGAAAYSQAASLFRALEHGCFEAKQRQALRDYAAHLMRLPAVAARPEAAEAACLADTRDLAGTSDLAGMRDLADTRDLTGTRDLADTRGLADTRSLAASTLAEKATPTPVERAKSLLDAEFTQPLTLDSLCAACGLGKFRLIRQFKSRYGLAPYQYMTTLRVNFAKSLLASGRQFIDVAQESGFYDQSHFIRCFRAYTGVTPGHYRPGKP